ncbi:hypothetical protein PSTG_12760 [Puccinia striiformis f. sp. tritici PST-78]|uniref:Uncharacterized protein n=1 Tax=Puccinia striiformis f. sp. tritici PST-78 TaxID=1165861 RepID=A0A0L0V3I7_9BASI|nr:hypothetical protein PSTG_12760 [Puccinia striiformis f. sp. tritici PST-78]
MSSTLRSFVFIAVYFSDLSAAFSSSLIPQHMTGFVTTATPPRPAIDLIGIGPQKFAQPPHADFISPDYAAWPPLDQLNDRLGPAHLPHDLMGIGPEIFPTPGQAPHAESIAPEHAAWPPLDQLNDRLGPAHLPHDLMGIGPEIFPTRGQPPHADSPARPPLDALADSEDSNSFWSYKKTPNGNIIAHYPEDFVGSPKPLYHIPTYHKGQAVGPGPLKDYVFPHDPMVPSESPENLAPSPQSGGNRKLLANTPDDLTASPQIFRRPAPEHAAWPPLDQLNDRLGPAHPPHDLMGIGPEIFPTRGQPPHADSPARPPLDALTDSEDSNSFWTYKKTPNGNIIAHYPEDFVGSPKPLYHIPTYHKGQAVGPGPLKDYVFPHDPMVPSESPENLAPSPQSGGNRKLLANTPDDLTASPQIFRRPGLSSVYAFPAHTPPLRNFFEGRPELEEVAEKQGKALVQGKREPISSDNLASWTKQNQDYLQLKPKDQEEIRTWLQQRFFDSDPTSKTGGKAIAYIWSLQKSTGKHLVWWGKSIINAGKTDEHEFIDLVEIGDTLSFFNKRANFEILDQHAEAISKKLLKILEYDSQKNLRGDALAIPTLIDVKGRGNVSMYKARMGQLMNIHLRHFDQKDVRSKEKVLQDLYFFVGQSREKAISKATNALKKSPESFKKLLTPERGVPGQADYERIEAALNSLGKGRFF